MNAPEKVLSPFERLSKINVNDHVEKKNGLSYLSWAWAVAELLKADPSASWSYGEPQKWNDTVMVFCTVTAFGKPMTSQLPVMNHRNQAIANPDAFQVNTAMQRCLAKAIALHGLGLYIYAGEDLPEEDKQPASSEDEKLLQQYRDAAMDGMASLKAFHSMCKGESKNRVWKAHGDALKAAAEQAGLVTA